MQIFSSLALGLSFAMALILAGPAHAETTRLHTKAVVELFTSQGCSSCPDADKLLTKINDQTDIVTLAYHVDYWDYIGWTDTFGSPENSEYQRAYAKSWGSSRIYTPQMVVNGTTGVVGSRQNDVNSAIGDANLELPITITTHNDMLKVAIPAHAGQSSAVVWLVSYKTQSNVAIERGENAGQTVQYTNVVTARQPMGMWEPETGADLKLPMGTLLANPNSGLAILVQQDRHGLPGPIIGAASIEN